MPFVLDASVALRWFFREEATTASDALLERAISGESIFVPANWPRETLNGIVRGVRQQRSADSDVEIFLKQLSDLNIEMDDQFMSVQWAEALPFTGTYQLSAYDAAYLALAFRLRIPLATFDDKLRTAATLEGLDLAV